jgi:hypothetical protein
MQDPTPQSVPLRSQITRNADDCTFPGLFAVRLQTCVALVVGCCSVAAVCGCGSDDSADVDQLEAQAPDAFRDGISDGDRDATVDHHQDAMADRNAEVSLQDQAKQIMMAPRSSTTQATRRAIDGRFIGPLGNDLGRALSPA